MAKDTSHATFDLQESGTLGTPSGKLPIGSTACSFFPRISCRKFSQSISHGSSCTEPSAKNKKIHPTLFRPVDPSNWGVLATSFVWMNQQSLAFEGCFDVIQSGILRYLQGFLEVFFVSRTWKGLCLTHKFQNVNKKHLKALWCISKSAKKSLTMLLLSGKNRAKHRPFPKRLGDQV